MEVENVGVACVCVCVCVCVCTRVCVGRSTSPNLEPVRQRGKQAYREGLSEFGAVRPHQTSSNHCDEGGQF